MLCDIGNGTIKVMYVNDKKSDSLHYFIKKLGTHQCMLKAHENLMRIHHTAPMESVVARVLRFGTGDIDEAYLKTITIPQESMFRTFFAFP